VEIEKAGVPVFTFALYHDHESGAVSVCVDTEEQSRATVRGINAYNAKHFLREIDDGNLKGAALWQANPGRSLSLGDFALVNLARTPLDGVSVSSDFYLEMVRAVVAAGDTIAAFATDPERLLFACSGPDDEVTYVWSLQKNA
jgi:hypothetical protein